jgi:carbon storage regulator
MHFMLVLTRHKNESIMVGDKIEIVVTGISGKNVKLGIVAPDSVTVHRKEIFPGKRHRKRVSDRAEN